MGVKKVWVGERQLEVAEPPKSSEVSTSKCKCSLVGPWSREVMSTLQSVINFLGPHFFICKTGGLLHSKMMGALVHVDDNQFEDSPSLFSPS